MLYILPKNGAILDKIEKVNLLAHGIIDKSELDNTEEYSLDSPTGYYIRTADVDVIEQTQKIKPEVGTIFGIKYEIVGVSGGAANFQCKIHHPQLISPESGVVFNESNENKSNYLNEENFDFYEFEECWEIKEGIWKFVIQQDETILLEKEFQIIKNV